MIISKEKIIYNKILENTNPETLKVLRANSLIKLFAQRIIETLSDANKQNAYRDFPFTINSFIWNKTQNQDDTFDFWFKIHVKWVVYCLYCS